jgi:hypothetical protein
VAIVAIFADNTILTDMAVNENNIVLNRTNLEVTKILKFPKPIIHLVIGHILIQMQTTYYWILFFRIIFIRKLTN